MTNDPTACANCHIMKEQFDGWVKSSHHGVAVCNDCHTPHNFVGKYAIKGLNGFHHSKAFTTGNFSEPIQIKPLNKRVTEAACRHCHQSIVHAIDPVAKKKEDRLSCIKCHESVGHMHM